MNLQSLKKLLETTKDPYVISAIEKYLTHPLYSYQPRPDNLEPPIDEQTSFCDSEFDGLNCILAGNSSGKTYSTAWRVATFVLNTEPPEPMTPFWVCSKNMEEVCRNCWSQNLSTFLTEEYIQDVHWYSQKVGWPRAVVLKPNAKGNNFVIEFKSYDQGRKRFEGANIAGFWCDEQIPLTLLSEIITRCRKWNYPGSKFYSLTPLEPDPDLEAVYAEKKPSWKFFRFSTQRAIDAGHVRKEIIAQMVENTLDELIPTRMEGLFASFKGMVYKNFTADHIIDPFEIPKTWQKFRGIDFGWDHETVCIWAARSPDGAFYMYKEYGADRSSIEDHVGVINQGWDYNDPTYCQTYADYSSAQERYEFAIRDLPTLPADKDIRSGIARIQSLFRSNRLFIFRDCEKLIKQMRLYVWDSNGKPMKVNDDFCDACRYVLASDKSWWQLDVKPVNAEPPKRDPYKTDNGIGHNPYIVKVNKPPSRLHIGNIGNVRRFQHVHKHYGAF